MSCSDSKAPINIPNKKPPISFANTPVHTESFEQRQNKSYH